MKKFSITIAFSLLMITVILLLDALETKMCKSFNIYRIFTINSTVCLNITTAIRVLEKLLITSLLTLGSFIFHFTIDFFSRITVQMQNYDRGSLSNNNLIINS